MNQLQYEKSPYLLAHADNPVDWMPWGQAAFDVAKREDRPVFLSIGCAACHWCHVMERESFADDEAAASAARPWTRWRSWRHDGAAWRIYLMQEGSTDCRAGPQGLLAMTGDVGCGSPRALRGSE